MWQTFNGIVCRLSGKESMVGNENYAAKRQWQSVQTNWQKMNGAQWRLLRKESMVLGLDYTAKNEW